MSGSETEHGSLFAISEQVAGDYFAASASIGATTLTLTDVSDFDEAGGSLIVAGTVYTYDTVDMTAETVHLTSGLTAAAAVGDPVAVWDVDTGSVVSWHTALVTIEGSDGDPVSADVDHSLVPLLASTTNAVGQSVSLARDGVGYRLVAVHGKQGSLDEVTLLAGGLTTRTDTTVAGVDIMGDNGGAPGIFAYGTGGSAGPHAELGTTAHTSELGLYSAASLETAGGSVSAITVASSSLLQLSSPKNGSGTTLAKITLQDAAGGGSVSLAGFANVTKDLSVGGVLTSTGAIIGSASVQTGSGFFDNSLTGSSTTATINSSGHIVRTPSSERYKDNIEPLGLDEAHKVLDLQPVTFTLKEEADDEHPRTYPGFIAEQAADVGAELWVNRDTEGRPDGFRYAEVVAALIPILREQQAAMDRLQQRLAALEGDQ